LIPFVSLVMQWQYAAIITFVHIFQLYFQILCNQYIALLLFSPLWFGFCNLKQLSVFMKLIMSGDIDSTFKRLGEWYPQVIKVVYSIVIDLI
jgi:hypothetical protein